jgi:uncharacterized protein YrzB (UPF0473 family)
LPYIGIDSPVVASNEAIKVVNKLPEIGNETCFYKVIPTQKIYYWDGVNNNYICLNLESEDFIDTNTDNILVVNDLPETGEENILYKLPDQSFYYWNSISNSFVPLVSIPEPGAPDEPEIEVRGGIEVVEHFADLPGNGEVDVLYKVLENEKIYSWNTSTMTYQAINEDSQNKTSILVVDNFDDLPEQGENDVLYKIDST